MNRDDNGDGYELFRQHAISLGKGAQWRGWTADEGCPQANVAADTIVESGIVDFCLLDPTTPEPVDPVEPGNVTDHALEFRAGEIPDANEFGLVINSTLYEEGTITNASLEVNIRHTWRGDVSITLVSPDGSRHEILPRSGSNSEDNIQQTFEVPQLLGESAAGRYSLVVIDHAGGDTGELLGATLHLSIAN